MTTPEAGEGVAKCDSIPDPQKETRQCLYLSPFYTEKRGDGLISLVCNGVIIESDSRLTEMSLKAAVLNEAISMSPLVARAEMAGRMAEALKELGGKFSKLQCECDSYNGFTCGLHEWKRIVDESLADWDRVGKGV